MISHCPVFTWNIALFMFFLSPCHSCVFCWFVFHCGALFFVVDWGGFCWFGLVPTKKNPASLIFQGGFPTFILGEELAAVLAFLGALPEGLLNVVSF